MTTTTNAGPPTSGPRLIDHVLFFINMSLGLAVVILEIFAPTHSLPVIIVAMIVAAATAIITMRRGGGSGGHTARTTTKDSVFVKQIDGDHDTSGRWKPRLGIFASTLATIAAGIGTIAYRLGLPYTGTRRHGLAGAS